MVNCLHCTFSYKSYISLKFCFTLKINTNKKKKKENQRQKKNVKANDKKMWKIWTDKQIMYIIERVGIFIQYLYKYKENLYYT